MLILNHREEFSSLPYEPYLSFLIGTALIVPASIGLIVVGYHIAYYQTDKQAQSFPQQSKGSLDNPNSQPEYAYDNPTSRLQ